MAEAAPSFERYTQFRRYLDIGFHPSGDLLYSCDLSGQFNLWSQPVLPHGIPGYPRAWTNWSDRSVRTIAPASDGNSVWVTADRDGDEFLQIYRVWLDGRGVETVTDAPGVQHQIAPSLIPSSSAELLYTDNARAREDMDVVVRHLKTGKTARPFPPGHFWDEPRFDPTRHRILAADALGPTDVHTHVLDRRRGKLEELLPHSEPGIVAPVDWTWDGTGVLLLTDLDREFRQLELYTFARKERRVLAAPSGDIEFVAFSPSAGVMAYSTDEDGVSAVYAGRLGKKMERVHLPKGSIARTFWGSQLALSRDGRLVAALWTTGQGPAEIHRAPVGPGSSTPVTNGMVGGVPDAPLLPPKLVRVPRLSGAPIPAFWYAPKPKIKGPWGAVLAIHGGPEGQERPGWEYGGLYQFLNRRGIAVLAPNIRGSTGFGKTYQRLIRRDWGGGDLEDLKACAEWLKARPDLDPRRLGVFGKSYGGFASLSCVTRLPQYWRAGVDICGPSNLVTFAKAVPPSWVRFMTELVGDPVREGNALLARSPVSYLDRVKADLLVIQGAKDPRVVKGESDQIVERLRASGRTVDYVVFENEGHGFTRRENEVRAYSASAEFLVARLAPP